MLWQYLNEWDEDKCSWGDATEDTSNHRSHLGHEAAESHTCDIDYSLEQNDTENGRFAETLLAQK